PCLHRRSQDRHQDRRVGISTGRRARRARPARGRAALRATERHGTIGTVGRFTSWCVMAQLLVIDDDPDVRETIAAILRRAGHDVNQAEGGAAGLTAYSRKRADVVVLDLLMPEMTGVEAIARLRQLDPGVKILAVTGGGQHHHTSEYLDFA